MSATKCPRCSGFGTICGRCGKPRERIGRGYRYGEPCCRGARYKPCPDHRLTTHACDVCLREVRGPNYVSTGAPHLKPDMPYVRFVDMCGACEEAWRQWCAVSFDRFAETRLGTAPAPPASHARETGGSTVPG